MSAILHPEEVFGWNLKLGGVTERLMVAVLKF
jgi:hypothetical protein